MVFVGNCTELLLQGVGLVRKNEVVSGIAGFLKGFGRNRMEFILRGEEPVLNSEELCGILLGGVRILWRILKNSFCAVRKSCGIIMNCLEYLGGRPESLKSCKEFILRGEELVKNHEEL